MNFRPELAAAVIQGNKWVTRRAVSDNPRSPYHPDRAPKMVWKRIAICPGRGKPRIGSARVVNVSRETFDPEGIGRREVMAEGFAGHAEFEDAWTALHGDLAPVDVWRIELGYPVELDGVGGEERVSAGRGRERG